MPYLGNDTSICSGTAIRLFPGDYKSYEWSNGVINNNSITVNGKGVFWVTVTDQNNCNASDTVNILNLYDTPENFLNDKTEICYGDVTRLQPTRQFAKYLWSTGDASNFIIVKDTGTFQLSVTDQNGCIGKESVIVAEKPDCPSNIYIPNAFTPNSDGLNEQFRPIIKGVLEKYAFTIYNRFGQVIFSTNDQSLAWDGRFKGQVEPGDIYVWYCNYQFKDKPMKTEKGTVTLVR
jgi:gliding motility-associated-like protein